MKPVLYVGNRNYSSWSLRPWLALSWGQVDFETRVVPLGGPGYGSRLIGQILSVSPAGTVPVLHIADEVIGDSLAISEWAAEQAPSLWPADAMARAHARSAVCEMHSSFSALRTNLTCNIRRRVEPRVWSEDVVRDVERIQAIWTFLRARFGGTGPYLFGESPTIADAFFTPVATRFRTYGVKLSKEPERYAEALLANPAFREWEEEGTKEPWVIPESESV